MRHTFATTLLDNGNDLKTVQTLMGHFHIRTTEAYLHSTDDRKVEAIRSLQFAISKRDLPSWSFRLEAEVILE
jgi:site-specific recombinase XerD